MSKTWAKIGELKAGDKVICTGFDCIESAAIREIKQNIDGLYIDCRGIQPWNKGYLIKHHISAQLDANGYYIGLEKC